MTGIKATNWPTLDEAREAIERESTKGQNVMSRRRRDRKRHYAVDSQLAELKERAERHFRRVAAGSTSHLK
jgi:hypothetical protein